MCIKLTQDYSQCGHHSTSITKCPTYYKQKNAGRSFLSFILCQGEKKRKHHCGRLVPHHVLVNEPFCEKCLVAQGYGQSLRGQPVGRGAVLVDRPSVDDYSKKRGKHSRQPQSSTSRGESRRHQHQHHYGHHVADSQASVWLPDAYHAPEKFAKPESYRRDAARAPPVSPPKPLPKIPSKSAGHHHHSSSSRRADREARSGGGGRSKHAREHDYYHRGTPTEPTPTYHVQPQRRGQSSTRKQHIATAMADVPAAAAPVTSPTTTGREEPPPLRRKPGKTGLNIRNQPLYTIPTTLPEYQVYLNAMPSLTATTPRSAGMRPLPSPIERSGKSTTRSRKPRVVLDKDDDSDLSFVCTTSRRLSETPRARG